MPDAVERNNYKVFLINELRRDRQHYQAETGLTHLLSTTQAQHRCTQPTAT